MYDLDREENGRIDGWPKPTERPVVEFEETGEVANNISTKAADVVKALKLPELPYRVEVVAPKMKKPGLRVFGPEPASDYAHKLIEDGLITREHLREFGFIIFENHVDERVDGEILLRGNKDQWIHQDSNVGEDTDTVGEIKVGVKPGDANLGIGEKESVFQAMVKIFLNDPEKWQQMIHWENIEDEIDGEFVTGRNMYLVRSLIEDLQSYPGELKNPRDLKVSEVHQDAYPDYVGQAWIDVLFNLDLAYFRPDENGTLLRQLYKEIEENLYVHHYGQNQMVLFDNENMVHGRLENPNSTTATQGVGMAFDYYWREGEGLN